MSKQISSLAHLDLVSLHLDSSSTIGHIQQRKPCLCCSCQTKVAFHVLSMISSKSSPIVISRTETDLDQASLLSTWKGAPRHQRSKTITPIDTGTVARRSLSCHVSNVISATDMNIVSTAPLRSRWALVKPNAIPWYTAGFSRTTRPFLLRR